MVLSAIERQSSGKIDCFYNTEVSLIMGTGFWKGNATQRRLTLTAGLLFKGVLLIRDFTFILIAGCLDLIAGWLFGDTKCTF